MTKKTKVMISVIALIIMILMIQCNVYATEINPDAYNPGSTTVVSGADKFESIANNIIGPIKVIGSIVSVIALIVIGIKYIFGSIEEKAEYKKTMVPYVIGAVMVFAITNLLGILVDVIGGIQ